MSSKSYPNEQEYNNRNSMSDYGSMQNNMMNSNSMSNNYNNNSDSSISSMNTNSNMGINNMNSMPMNNTMSMNNKNNNMNMNNMNNMNNNINNNINNMNESMKNNISGSMNSINNSKFTDYSHNGVVKKELNSTSNHDSSLKYQDFQKQNFIGKLIEMLNNPEISDLISWHEDKVSVIIKNINEFSGRALPMYFKHNKFNSFTRQLNTYGFSYKKIDDQTFKFQNENFIENKPELLKYISKKKNKNDEDIQSLQIELNDLKLSHGQLQREYNSLRQVVERMRMENNDLRMMNAKLQNQVEDLQKMNSDIDSKYNSMKVNNGKIYYNLISILENLKVNENQDHEYISDIQSINNECFEDDNSVVYNKRRCTSSSESTHSTFTQNTGNSIGINMPSVHKSNSYNMNITSSNNQQNMPMNMQSSHHSIKNMNMSSRSESPRNQSLNNKINNGSYNNSPREMAVPKNSYVPSNNQRTHSLNNPLNNNNQGQYQQINQHTENSNHNRRSSSLGMMKDSSKRNSISYSISPVNKYPPSQNNGSSIGINNEVTRPPRPLSAQSAKKIHRLSNTSYLNSPNSLELETEQMNHPMTESSNQNFLSVDNQINNTERNTPSISSVPNYYPNQSRLNKTESIRSAPSIMSNNSNFTLSGISSSDSNSQRSSYTIKSPSNTDELINRNNTYPLNKNVLDNNNQMEPTKSYTIPKDHCKNQMYNDDESDIDYYSKHSKQNSISYLLNPSQGKQMQEQMMMNDNMDMS